MNLKQRVERLEERLAAQDGPTVIVVRWGDGDEEALEGADVIKLRWDDTEAVHAETDCTD